ncbi:MAG: exosortase B [Leptothrix sp. (in: Bacteria)]|nr:exosortase B [Leptothrix sp. (in: b-proteobacteria)]
MAQSAPTSGAFPSAPSPVKFPVWSLAVICLAFAIMYVPTFMTLAQTTWATDEQGHGPLILAACAWLLWGMRTDLFSQPAKPAVVPGFLLLAIALLMYVVGRSQRVIEFEASSLILVVVASLLLIQGLSAVKRAWFPILFLLFMVPLPGAFVQALTLPLKSAVSMVAEQVLYWAGYPIGRTGVTLMIGPYQLLVADACSGLNSLFTLESLGLLYMNIMNYKSKTRNLILAIGIIPISFIANVTRVIILVLITYYLGDEVGQGFAHEFAGLVLFSVALVLTYGLDRLLAARFDNLGGARDAR